MKTFISIAVAGLSILVPLLYIRLLRKTRNGGTGSNTKFNRSLALGIVIWSIFIWISGTQGLFAYEPGDVFPRFLIPLFFPVMVLLVLIFTSAMQRSLHSISLRQLVGFQFWRVFGAVFFLIAAEGLGPEALNASGFGDLLTGLLAMLAYYLLTNGHKFAITGVWAFMAVGVFDLLGVLYTALAYYPIWSDAVPSSAFVGSFPMILLMGIVAPIALLFHIFTLRKLLHK